MTPPTWYDPRRFRVMRGGTMRCVNLIGEHMPHPVVRIDNNLGTETTEYLGAVGQAKPPRQTQRQTLDYPSSPSRCMFVGQIETYVTRLVYHHGLFRSGKSFNPRLRHGRAVRYLSHGHAFAAEDNIAPESHVPPWRLSKNAKLA
jgi:hypothetical protein